MAVKGQAGLEGKFNWRVPTIVSSFIEGPDAEAFLDEFNGRADKDYNGNRNVKVLNYMGQVITGSNPFAVILANQILRPLGIRTATPADLGRILDSNSLPLKGHYEDAALVVRTKGYSDDFINGSLAKDMVAQVRARGLKPSAKNPIMIPLTGFDLVNADNLYGLAFKLRDDAELIESPVLLGRPGRTEFNKTADNGLPIIRNGGQRGLYTRNDSLSRLHLTGAFDIGSIWNVFCDSDLYGRVVVIRQGRASDFSA